MKMVVRGAQAPKCDTKPTNPTSAARVGTMSGQAAGKLGPKGSVAVTDHKQQYQGLLQAPRIPGIFDHQLIKTNNAEEKAAGKKGAKDADHYPLGSARIGG